MEDLLEKWEKETRESIDTFLELDVTKQQTLLKQNGFTKLGTYGTTTEYNILVDSLNGIKSILRSVKSLENNNHFDLYANVFPINITFGYKKPYTNKPKKP
tara:strand:- start:4295 stop:4597 length:303 start_codon:yes stop_codon:yes gene_type:complete